MIKSAFAIAGIFTVAALILSISLLRAIHPHLAFSRSLTLTKAALLTPSPPVSPTPTLPPVNYYLPYPGILPDHFLWPLKAFRDFLWVRFSFSPASKAEKLLHLADKRIGAAEALINGGQFQLGATTATKAGKYLEQALLQEQQARSQDQNTDQLLDRLAKSALKQQEIITHAHPKLPPEVRPTLDQALKYAKATYDAVTQRLLEKHLPAPGKN